MINLQRPIQSESSEIDAQRVLPTALDRLVVENGSSLYRFIAQCVDSRFEAEKIMQASYLAISNELQSNPQPTVSREALFSVAVKLLRLRKDESGIAAPLKAERVACDSSDSNRSRLFNIAIERLPFEYKLAFLLRDVLSFSKSEVAAILELSIDDSSDTCSRARLMVRRYFLRELSAREQGFNNIECASVDAGELERSESDRNEVM